mmetsp:Transcript_25934/g.34022  ORF Transcript_25934/g.34022 Transcript_25934/m.34022 type:complete len:153 (+) Transcript_25934:213-671(+)|eukprot:CAMPEP_0117757072 /NCGR_PEP_ID=MMETSP0947-20121206/14492_1 /TAXON_ID=44440 /ORGANISM="Chattonella subsalsa, Strain CCMP2191" /LENGTH=152 /DNA_ID=CAMNT_0005576853 /DNA_START=111 /DNA_END=569 /DNA_ORIENTATION=-
MDITSKVEDKVEDEDADEVSGNQESLDISWEDIKMVQALIERCLQQYLTQTEIITALQIQANIDPSFTCLVWQKLEEQNPDFFYAYNIRLRVKDQIVAFNYLVDQHIALLQNVLTPSMPQLTPLDEATTPGVTDPSPSPEDLLGIPSSATFI